MTQERRTSTITDVARAAGVSPATVSRAMNGNRRVDPALVERVQAAAREVNYRPNGAGRALRRQRSDLWAVIVPDVRNPFFTGMVEAFEKVAIEEGNSVVLFNSQEDVQRERDSIESAIAHQVSGVLIAAASTTRTRLADLERAGIPVITIDRRVQGFSGDTITVDNLMIGRLAAEHFLASGRTSALIISTPARLTPTLDRERGFRRRMEEAGHPVDDARVLHLEFHDPAARETVGRLLDAHPEVDAVFATTNSLTAETFQALRDSGRRIGPDVALIGTDDDQWNQMVEPPVTVVVQPVEQLGRWAGQLLAARARGQSLDNARITLDPVLIARASSAP